jgi:hypothetical protein
LCPHHRYPKLQFKSPTSTASEALIIFTVTTEYWALVLNNPNEFPTVIPDPETVIWPAPVCTRSISHPGAKTGTNTEMADALFKDTLLPQSDEVMVYDVPV